MMFRNSSSFLLVVLSLIAPVGSLLISGCSKGEPTAEAPAPEAGGGRRGGRMGGPGGGPGGGRFAPVAADAKASEIFAQKCQGCHGDKGQGARGPSLLKVSSQSDDALFKTIHDGKDKMPAFGNQMTEAQMKELVAYVKTLGA